MKKITLIGTAALALGLMLGSSAIASEKKIGIIETAALKDQGTVQTAKIDVGQTDSQFLAKADYTVKGILEADLTKGGGVVETAQAGQFKEGVMMSKDPGGKFGTTTLASTIVHDNLESGLLVNNVFTHKYINTAYLGISAAFDSSGGSTLALIELSQPMISRAMTVDYLVVCTNKMTGGGLGELALSA